MVLGVSLLEMAPGDTRDIWETHVWIYTPKHLLITSFSLEVSHVFESETIPTSCTARGAQALLTARAAPQPGRKLDRKEAPGCRVRPHRFTAPSSEWPRAWGWILHGALTPAAGCPAPHTSLLTNPPHSNNLQNHGGFTEFWAIR